ncbi:hypothetical protein [Microvirga sp. Mcv34]|uniref:hypothetical protein n=1 Tax=Microvirga sp. Mcv34 TaxID=2926016 RepID=UPI0021CA9A9F|nr:hypothetical protein [Microvirga sp. Mcv34]
MGNKRSVTAEKLKPRRRTATRRTKKDALAELQTHPRVEIVDDEREMGNSVIITLNRGWRFNDEGEHVFGEDTPEECLVAVNTRVKPCACSECQAAKKKVV